MEMTAPLTPARSSDRSVAARLAPAARSTAAAADDDLTAEQQAQLAAQHAAFDYQAAETAEFLREHQALEALMQENLKNEDEIMKKWIALI
jgi:erythromycin esterase-like protein